MKHLVALACILCACRCLAAVVADLADEPGRPQFHYSPRVGWGNDPNGLVWKDGEWHFFHQHNPYDIKWGKMHWAHAVSRDLVHWEWLGDKLYPDALGAMFSGCAVVDKENTAGFGRNAIVFLYTAAGKPDSQCLAYSTDGRTLVKYAGNPVMPDTPGWRDPKVFWHAPSKAWVMIIYGSESNRHVFAIFRSPDLKRWTRASTYAGDERGKGTWHYECPGLDELTIEGETNTAWVVWSADCSYDVGSFDGFAFTPREERISWPSGEFYAAQTFANVPDGRVIWSPWMRIKPGYAKDSSQLYGIPQELALRRTAKGLRLVHRPVRELESLREGDARPLADFDGELAEVWLSADLHPRGSVSYELRGVPLAYDYAGAKLKVGEKTVDWPAEAGKLRLRVYVDRVGVEVFSQDGLNMTPCAAIPDPASRRMKVLQADKASNVSGKVYALKSIYK